MTGPFKLKRKYTMCRYFLLISFLLSTRMLVPVLSTHVRSTVELPQYGGSSARVSYCNHRETIQKDTTTAPQLRSPAMLGLRWKRPLALLMRERAKKVRSKCPGSAPEYAAVVLANMRAAP